MTRNADANARTAEAAVAFAAARGVPLVPSAEELAGVTNLHTTLLKAVWSVAGHAVVGRVEEALAPFEAQLRAAVAAARQPGAPPPQGEKARTKAKVLAALVAAQGTEQVSLLAKGAASGRPRGCIDD